MEIPVCVCGAPGMASAEHTTAPLPCGCYDLPALFGRIPTCRPKHSFGGSDPFGGGSDSVQFMPTSIRFSLVLVLSVASISCRLGPCNGQSTVSVYGSWRWVKTQGAWTGSLHTPELSGYDARVLFQENGIAQFYRNDTLLNEIPYTLSTTNRLRRGKDVFVIHWKSNIYPDSQYILFRGNDTLHLTGRGTEISHFYYVRIRQ